MIYHGTQEKLTVCFRILDYKKFVLLNLPLTANVITVVDYSLFFGSIFKFSEKNWTLIDRKFQACKQRHKALLGRS